MVCFYGFYASIKAKELKVLTKNHKNIIFYLYWSVGRVHHSSFPSPASSLPRPPVAQAGGSTRVKERVWERPNIRPASWLAPAEASWPSHSLPFRQATPRLGRPGGSELVGGGWRGLVLHG